MRKRKRPRAARFVPTSIDNWSNRQVPPPGHKFVPVTMPSGLVVPLGAQPHGSTVVTRLNSAKIVEAAKAGHIPTDQMESMAYACPELLKIAGGPLVDLRVALGHVGAFLFDVSQEVYIVNPTGQTKVRESLARFEQHVAAFNAECQRAEKILIPPAGQTPEQYVLHLMALAQDALLTARKFAAWKCGQTVYLHHDQMDINQIRADDLRVRRALSREFEHLARAAQMIAARKSEPPAPGAGASIQPIVPPIASAARSGGRKPAAAVSHGPDFRSVRWFGATYFFTSNQAACVKLLWESWERGIPDVGGATLLQAAGVDSERLDHVFRGCPAWGKMILRGATKGSYRLQESPKPAQKPPRKKSGRRAK